VGRAEASARPDSYASVIRRLSLGASRFNLRSTKKNEQVQLEETIQHYGTCAMGG
jgi:hypothetical protein